MFPTAFSEDVTCVLRIKPYTLVTQAVGQVASTLLLTAHLCGTQPVAQLTYFHLSNHTHASSLLTSSGPSFSNPGQVSLLQESCLAPSHCKSSPAPPRTFLPPLGAPRSLSAMHRRHMGLSHFFRSDLRGFIFLFAHHPPSAWVTELTGMSTLTTVI